MTLVQYFSKLESLQGTNAKITLLTQASDAAKAVLQYAYQPLKMYGVKKIDEPASHGKLSIEDNFLDVLFLLDHLADGSLSGNHAKSKITAALSELDPLDAELLKKIILKDLRCGISVTTINKALPGLIEKFGAMLAKTYNGEMPYEGMFISLKLDGLRAIFKGGQLYTRNGHVIQGVQHITRELSPDRSYDGELLIPNLHFQESSGKLRSFSACPDAVYHIFDLPEDNGRFEGRLAEMRHQEYAYAGHPHIRFVRHSLVKDTEAIQRNFAKAIAAGYEGLVIKTVDHFYQTKRSSDWLKLKLVQSEDLPIIGFFEGEGKYVGSLGGIIVDRDGVPVKVGGGFSDDLRHEIWDNQDRYLGLIVEVLYHEVTPDGSLRHPRFKHFRSDK